MAFDTQRYSPSAEERERASEEWHYNDLRAQKAEGVGYYLSRGWQYKPCGIRLNEKIWTCDDCQKLFCYPALKYCSAKNIYKYEKIYVCSSCKGRNGYNNDTGDKRGSVIYFQNEWELGAEQIADYTFIVPKLIRQISEYKIYEDLETLLWVRRRMTKSTLKNPSPEELALSRIIERLRVNYVRRLNLEESVCILGQLLTSNRINGWQCYTPSDEIISNCGEQPLEAIWDKYPFPVLDTATQKVDIKYYDCHNPYVKSILSL